MFKIYEDNSIEATRGDILFFSVDAEYDDGRKHTFIPGDLLRIKVFTKKNAKDVLLQKDFPVTEETTSVDIFLTGEDMKIGDVISKPKILWYEVELNPDSNPQTIIGYDADGARTLTLYPEGADIDSFEIEPEDIPIVDSELDLSSNRPIENQAVARALISISARAEAGVVSVDASMNADTSFEQIKAWMEKNIPVVLLSTTEPPVFARSYNTTQVFFGGTSYMLGSSDTFVSVRFPKFTFYDDGTVTNNSQTFGLSIV